LYFLLRIAVGFSTSIFQSEKLDIFPFSFRPYCLVRPHFYFKEAGPLQVYEIARVGPMVVAVQIDAFSFNYLIDAA